MTLAELQEFALLMAFVRARRDMDLYRGWGSVTSFEELPTISRADLIRVPLSRRRYKDERSLVKIAHSGDLAFLTEWAFDDIGREEFGIVAKRPLVYMSDAHEAIEKSVWCYERGIVPLIGESDPDLAAYAAMKYRIDSMIADPLSVIRFMPNLQKLSEPLDSITLIAESFDLETLPDLTRFARRIRLTLALPETGAIAQADPAKSPLFSPVASCFIERNAEGVVVTKRPQLVTPIIRYQTSVPAHMFA